MLYNEENLIMKWVGISGSWRKMTPELERDVRRCVKEIISQDGGIVSGGAWGVDWVATDEVLKLDPTAQKIKIFLPTTLEIYAAHYRKRAKEEVITEKQAEELINQLLNIKKINPDAIIENPNNKVVGKDTYYERNSEIINVADELIAFHVNESLGTKDAIDKARKKGIPVKVFTYTI